MYSTHLLYSVTHQILGLHFYHVLLGLQPEVSQCTGIDDNCDLHNEILILSWKYACDTCILWITYCRREAMLIFCPKKRQNTVKWFFSHCDNIAIVNLAVNVKRKWSSHEKIHFCDSPTCNCQLSSLSINLLIMYSINRLVENGESVDQWFPKLKIRLPVLEE